MGLFNRNRKKKEQLEAEWQVIEHKDGESLFDALDRAFAEGKLTQRAKGEIKPPPSDGEWLMTAALSRLSSAQTIAGLDAVRQARKNGVN